MLILFIIVLFGIQLPYIQNKIVPIVTKNLSKTLDTEVSVGNVSIDLLSHIHINQILIKDYKKDTMIYIESLDNRYVLDLEINKPFKLNEKKIAIDGVKFYLDNTLTDSVFNITHTFKKNKSKDSTVKVVNKKSGTNVLSFLNLGEIELTNLSFRLKDKYNFQTLSISSKKIFIDALPLKLIDSPWIINSLLIQNTKAQLTQHPSPIRVKDYKPEYLAIPFNLNIAKFNLKNAEFKILDEASKVRAIKNQLTFQDLLATNLNIDAENVVIRKLFFTAKINRMTAKEKSGLEIKNMKTDFYFSSFKTEAKNLIFQTNYSKFDGYLRFDYKHMRQYLRFAEWVNVTAKMKNSNLNLTDLAYFTPALNDWKHLDVKFNTSSKGRMNDFSLINFNGTLHQEKMKVNGNLQVKDLFNGKGLNVLAKFNQVNFDKKDIEYVFQKPNLPQEIANLGQINYQGSFTGNPIKFILNGKLNTIKGGAELTETNFDFTQKNLPVYKGKVKLNDLKLAQIMTSESPIDRVSADILVDGKGFNIQSMNTYLKGNIERINIKNSTYQNVDIDGTWSEKLFTGKIISKDPSLLVDMNGKISMKEENPNLELSINLKDIDLKKLGYTKKQLLLNSNLFAIGRGKNIDEMLGTVLLKDMYVIDKSNNSKVYKFSNLTLEKDKFEEGGNYLDINSDEINASIVGKYKVSELPILLKEYLFSYLSIEEHNESKFTSNSYFNLQLDLKNISNYTLLFHEELKNIERGKINMRFDGINNKLKITGNLYNTEYLQFKIPNISLNNESSRSDFNSTIDFDSVYFQNKLAVTPLKTSIIQANEGLKISMELLNRKDDKFVDFNSIIKKKGNEYSFHILPFTSHFGRKVWTLHPDNFITLNTESKTINIKNLELYKDRQIIRFSNKNNSLTTVNALFDEVKLEELISGFMPILKSFKGDLNGEIDIENILTKPTPVANLDIKNIEYETEKIGNLVLKSDFENNILSSNFNLKGDKIDLSTSGSYNANTSIDSLYAHTEIKKLNLNVLNRYLKDLVYDMSGNISGDLTIFGKINSLQSVGTIQVDSLNTFLNTIHTRYDAKNQKIYITPGKFTLNNFRFTDEEGNEAVADGFVSHNNLKSFNLFLNAESSKLLCLNTNSTHNPYFYGKVYADAKIQFRGTIGNRITISSQGKNLPNSEMTIAFGSTQRTEKFGFYEFIKRDSTNLISKLSTSRKLNSGVNLDFDFEVNSFGKLNIVMDPTLDDKMECTGDGRIHFTMSPESDIDMKGTYEINSGSYLFTYQNVVQRVFYLNKGGKMTFVGNPRASLIDASARFTTRASANELVSAYFVNSTESRVLSAAKSLVKVNITLSIKDKITQPKIDYSIDVEQNNPEVTSAFEAIKTTLINNEAERNKQVLGLLVWQRFFPPSTQTNSNLSTDLQNTAVGVVTSKLSSYFTEWMQNTFKGMNFDLNFRNYNQQDRAAQITDTRNELKFAVSQKLLNDRLIFNLGGNYDFGKNQVNSQNTAFFGGDVDIEYKLTEQGNVRAKIYSTLSNDPLNSVYINKTGLGILFQKEFDEFNQIFKKQKK